MSGSAVQRVAKVAVFAVLASSSSACFASASQLGEVRDDVGTVRAEAAVADSIRAVQMAQIMGTLRDVSDSVASLSQRLTRLRAETQAEVRGMRQTVAQVQETSGQSEARLKELRSQIDTRMKQAAPPPAPAPAAVDSVPVPDSVAQAPSAEELFQIGRDQLTRGANSAARAAFADLLKGYPDSELASEAQFYIAESYAAEGATARADSAYARVVTKYAESPRAPTSLYKRGVMAQTARRTTSAKRLFNDLIQRYPSSDEAELARERLRVMS
ncbi:MAG: tol-pal system protein YbgF [Gemmatimonadales bacterium]